MKRTILETGDGSKTIHIPEWNEQYHSKHGAVQEAMHVFINCGLLDMITLSRKRNTNDHTLSILEYGLGTGLNALLTAQHIPEGFKVEYTGIEAYPITGAEAAAVDYGRFLNDEGLYNKLHELSWEHSHEFSTDFKLTKLEKTFEEVHFKEQFDIIYYDAFGPRVQPQLWNTAIFKSAFAALKPSGILTTYCAQGQARRNMQEAGFTVQRAPGPPGKREMLIARKG